MEGCVVSILIPAGAVNLCQKFHKNLKIYISIEINYYTCHRFVRTQNKVCDRPKRCRI